MDESLSSRRNAASMLARMEDMRARARASKSLIRSDRYRVTIIELSESSPVEPVSQFGRLLGYFHFSNDVHRQLIRATDSPFKPVLFPCDYYCRESNIYA